jgi:Tfp pilus assembly protein PilV
MTLIEVMAALMLATVALLGALALLLSSTRGGVFARSLTEASTLVQSKLETVAARSSVTSSSPADGLESQETKLDAFGAVNTTAGQYTRTTVWSTQTIGSCTRRRATVTVTWSDAFGTPHTVTAWRERAI